MDLARGTANRSEDLRVELRQIDGDPLRYAVHLSSPAGESDGEFRIPFTPQEVDQALASISVATAQWIQRSTAADAGGLDPVKDIGIRLFDALCSGRLRAHYDRLIATAQTDERVVRLRLVIDSPGAEAMPWEYLYDSVLQDFVALSARSPLVRQRAGATSVRPMAIESPLRVLLATAEVVPGMGIDREIAILQGLRGKHVPLDLELDILRGVTAAQLMGAVRDGSYHVLHFVGTGADMETGPTRQALAVMRPDATDPATEGGEQPNNFDLLPVRDLAAAVRDQSDLRLVYLSACTTEWAAAELSEVVPAALGMRDLVDVEACLHFTEGFYSAVLAGQPLDMAVTAGRQQVDERLPGGREWGLPVFYLTAADGVLVPRSQVAARTVTLNVPVSFEAAQAAAPDDPVHGQTRVRLEALLAMHRRNLQVLADRSATYKGGGATFITAQVEDATARVADLEAQLAALTKQRPAS